METKQNSVGDKLRDAAQRAERELQQTIAYINDKVVPQVRQQSSEGLRAAADQLHRLADDLERSRK